MIYNGIIFEQNDPSPHNSRPVTFFLNEQYRENWLSTNGTIGSVAKSPELSLLDFDIWNFPKENFYSFINVKDTGEWTNTYYYNDSETAIRIIAY